MARKAVLQRRNSDIRLMVADQNLMNCQLLVGALRRCRNIEVVARATSSEQILAAAKLSQPGIALIGANLQDGSLTGFEAVRKLRNSYPAIRAVLLLDSADRASVIDAFRAGAKGIFSRDDSLATLADAFKTCTRAKLGRAASRSMPFWTSSPGLRRCSFLTKPQFLFRRASARWRNWSRKDYPIARFQPNSG